MQTKVKGYRGLGINYNCDHELGFYSNSQVTRNGGSMYCHEYRWI